MTDYISSPRDMLTSGNSSRLAAHRTKMGRDANGDIAAAIAPARNADASPLPTTNSSTPGRVSVTAQATAPAKPAAKISDEQLHLNYRAAAVLMHPKAEGKGDAVMAMLNADKRLTAAQAITRLDALPFDDPKRQAEAKVKAANDVWDQAHARVFGTGNSNAVGSGAHALTKDAIGGSGKPLPPVEQNAAADVWAAAHALAFPNHRGPAETPGGAQPGAATTSIGGSGAKPSASSIWDRAQAGIKVD